MQWLMLQQEKPEDFVIASGRQYSVREFISLAAKFLDMNIQWTGEDVNEVGKYNGEVIVKIDPQYFRPSEVDSLLGDASNAHKKLGWAPKIDFFEMVKEMIYKDLELAKGEKSALKSSNINVIN